jgi:hypothetical protein
MTRQAWWLVAAIGCAAPDPGLPGIETAKVPADPPPAPRSWRPLAEPVPLASAGAPQLLTDGTVLVQEVSTPQWFRLTPDENGGYEHGTWSQIAPAPPGYSPLYYASGVLPDGRFIVDGGEYINGNPTWSTRGAIYDPITDTWQEITPPLETGWDMIGDASGIVLANGTFMLSACCSKELALLDPISLTWTPIGTGKADENDEESWAKLPDGRILTVDANNHDDVFNSEIFDPVTGEWTSAGDTPVKLADIDPDPGVQTSHEIGPEILRPDGTVVAIGGTVHNAVFDTHTMTWSALPDTPLGLDVADGPAALLPNGDVLIAASAGVFQSGVHLFELHDATFTEVDGTPNAPGNTSYQHSMLVLPTGEILMTDYTSDIELYTPAPGVVESAVPVILGAPEVVGDGPVADTAPIASLYPGRTFTIAVRRMNGASQGAYYGDDEQASTDFPIVRVTNTETGHASYCRTHGHSDRSLAPDEHGTTKFDVPDTIERGPSQLVVIANGIASPPIDVNVR